MSARCQWWYRLRLMVAAGLVSVILAVTDMASADQTDPALGALFAALKTSHRPEQAAAIESEIWSRWAAHKDKTIATAMQRGIALMQAGQLAAAETTFSAIITRDPNFAEAWNKRATVRFFRGDHSGSRQDIAVVIDMIHMKNGDPAAALTAYQAARQQNPFLPDIDRIITQISRQLNGASI
jgi:tetratricopeptide (TPR) repeat protein